MIKVVSVLQRKPGLSVEDFQRYWLNTHAAIVSKLPGLRRYVQSHTLLSGYRKTQPAADGIAEFEHPRGAAIHRRARFDSADGQAIVEADIAGFAIVFMATGEEADDEPAAETA